MAEQEGHIGAVKLSACQRCHARKVRCSGEQPSCSNCKKVSQECLYPSRDRRIKVKESYLRQLIAENARLRARHEPHSRQPEQSAVGLGTEYDTSSPASPDESRGDPDPAAGGQPWFVDIDLPHVPTPINEAADTAFATRVRQVLSEPNDPPCIPPGHTDFASDDEIMSLAEQQTPWPKPARARMLVDVALMHTSRGYHIVRKSAVFEALEQSLSDPNWRDPVMECKLRGLFALGELCSSRFVPPNQSFPGLRHFAKATKILSYLGEWPTLDFIEIRLIQSIYSFTLNRVYASYTLAGSALRMAVIMGLHLNIPVAQLPDPVQREHRVRVWWTAYILDRMWACKLGCPPAIQDEEIKVRLPSDPPTTGSLSDDFSDQGSRYYACYVRLATIMNNVVQSIYTEKDHITTLFTTVQQRLLDLKNWVEELPESFSMNTSAWPNTGYHKYDILSLHMTLNQTIILATRPILLYGLRLHTSSPPKQIPLAAKTLIDTCITCARHTCRLLSSSWINGAFPALYHDLTQYLFSALTVLAASSLLDHEDSLSDREWFEESVQLLEQLKDSGNFPAREFHRHVKLIISSVKKAEERRSRNLTMDVGMTMAQVAQPPVAVGAGPTPIPVTNSTYPESRRDEGNRITVSTAPISAGPGTGSSTTNILAAQAVETTAETALAEPSLQELLMQPTIDMQFPESTFDFLNEENGIYWPEFEFQQQGN